MKSRFLTILTIALTMLASNLQASADPASEPSAEHKQFCDALTQKDFKQAEQLLKSHPKIDINYTFTGQPSLLSAINRLQVEQLKFLVEHGANIDITTPDYPTPLHNAISISLIGQNIDCTTPNTEIHKYKNYKTGLDILSYLLINGADFNIRSASGNEIFTPLEWATYLNCCITALFDEPIVIIDDTIVDKNFEFSIVKLISEFIHDTKLAPKVYTELQGELPTVLAQIVSEYLDKHISKRRPGHE